MGVEIKPGTSELIKRMRWNYGISQAELCSQAGISLTTFRKLESGRQTKFNGRTLSGVCKTLDIRIDEIIQNNISK